jgi:hypothetical protein
VMKIVHIFYVKSLIVCVIEVGVIVSRSSLV